METDHLFPYNWNQMLAIQTRVEPMQFVRSQKETHYVLVLKEWLVIHWSNAVSFTFIWIDFNLDFMHLYYKFFPILIIVIH